MERVEPQARYDQGVECGEAPVRHLQCYDREPDKPCLRIEEGFQELGLLESLRFDAGVIRSFSLNDDELLSVTKPFGFQGIVGQKPEHYCGPQYGEGSKSQKYDLPGLKGTSVVADKPSHKAVQYRCNDIQYDTVTLRLLLWTIPPTPYKSAFVRCRGRLCHTYIATTSVIAGINKASKPPSRNRQMKRPVKFVHAAMHISVTPQKKTLIAKKVTAGRRCRQYAAGPMNSRPPKNGAEPHQEYSWPVKFKSCLSP